MNNKMLTITAACLVSAILFLSIGAASAANIDPYGEGSRYAWGENIGWLSFDPLFGSGVTVTDTELYGYVWAENIGWINLNCENRGTCDDVHYRVTNDGSGILGGYAWGENVGWISFSCENNEVCGTADYGVTIGPAGYFSGYAWGENIGWINFDLVTQPGLQLLTSWEEDSGNTDNGGVPVGTGGPTGPKNKKPVIDNIVIEQQQNYTVRLTVTAYDPDGTIVSYSWQLSETRSIRTPRATVSHSFDGPGTYAVSVTVKDNNGAETSDVFTVEVVERDDDDAPPPAPEEPDCVEDTDCDDGAFCNGAETCIAGECAADDAPCTEDEVCIEDEQSCLTKETVTAISLRNTIRRPLGSRRCIWLVLEADGAEIFTPEACRITCSGPGGIQHGISFNDRREVKQFADYILVPLCIEGDVEPGDWTLSVQTESGSAREIIEFGFTIK